MGSVSFDRGELSCEDIGAGEPLLLIFRAAVGDDDAAALRTAAMSALAARYLAPAGSGCMAIIGNGAQSEFQARAFRALLGIGRIRLFDTDPAATAKCAANLIRCGFDVTTCSSAVEAIE